MMTPELVDILVDTTPFVIYIAVLWKLYRSWKLIKDGAEEVRKNKLAAVMLILAVVIGLLLGSNVYALAAYGKTYFSLRMFQLFLVGNCIVYWLLIDIIAADSVPDQEKARESTG